jgi:hypothetical protein
MWREEYIGAWAWRGAVGEAPPLALPLNGFHDSPATSIFLDSSDRLWLGADWGEWGGALAVADLNTGKVEKLTGAIGDGVYGIAEPKPGVVWTFGGTSHLGFLSAFVSRVAPAPRAQLFSSESGLLLDEKGHRRSPLSKPFAPVTHVVKRNDGKIWLVSYSQVFETDTSLKAFRHDGALTLRYVWGRPNAVGSFPAVVAAASDDGRLLLATAQDGLIEYKAGTAIGHAIAEQFGAMAITSIPSPGGLIVLTPSGASLRLSSGRWKDVNFRFSGSDEDPLSAPDTDTLDAEVMAAREAVAAWRRRSSKARRQPDRTWWIGETELVASGRGLCVLTPGSVDCSTVTIPGIDDVVTSLVRDNSGRLWVAGNGLWVINLDARVRAVHSELPFMVDTTVREIRLVDGRLVLMLGDRGVALLDVASWSF